MSLREDDDRGSPNKKRRSPPRFILAHLIKPHKGVDLPPKTSMSFEYAFMVAALLTAVAIVVVAVKVLF